MTHDRAALDRVMLRGLSWNAGGRWLGQLIAWASTLVVVRLLTPADYGLVGLASALFWLITIVGDGGIRGAIVNRQERDPQVLAQLNSVCLLVGIVMTGAAVLAAWPLASFYGEPKLVPVVLVTSISYSVLGFRMVPIAVLQRDLRFRTIAANDLVMVSVGAAVSVAVAMSGGGYWALIVSHLAGTTAATLLAIRAAPSRFARPNLGEIHETVRFGGHLLASQLAEWVRGSVDGIILGKFLGKGPLGVYRVAMDVGSLPLEKVGGVILQVAGPILASVRHDRDALRRYLLLVTEALAIVVWPVAVGTILIGDLAVPIVLGAQWREAVLPLRIIAVVALVRAISGPVLSTSLATGHSGRNARWSIVATTVVVLCMVPGVQFGLLGISIAWALGYPVAVAGILPAALGATDCSLRRYLESLRPAAVGCAAMVATVLAFRESFAIDSAPRELAASVTLGALTYAAVLACSARDRVRRIVELVRQRRL